MKGLIVKKKWLDLILDGDKTWEMRSTTTNVRGKIALIESGSGLVVGTCELLTCLSPLDTELEACLKYPNHRVKDIALLKKWRYPWVLANAKRLAEPIPYKHPQGAVVWVNLDMEI